MRNYKRKSSGSSDDQLKAAIKDYKINGLSLREAALKYGVSRETLRRHYAKVFDQPLDNITLERNYNFSTVFSESQEIQLKNYLLECNNLEPGIPSTRCRRFAYDLAVKNNIPIPQSWHKDCSAGKDWMRNFLRRQRDLSLRKREACSTGRTVCFNKSNVNTFYDNLEDLYRRFPDVVEQKRIYNLDEIVMTAVQCPEKVILPEETKQVHQNTGSEYVPLFTTCVIISASGQLLPPAMVFPRNKFNTKLLKDSYPGTLGLTHLTGCMTSELYLKVLEHFIIWTNSSKENQSILIKENHESHLSIAALDWAKEHGVHIIYLPPYTSHKLQPLNYSVFAPFKEAYDSNISSWEMTHAGMHVTVFDLASLVNDALTKAASQKNIESAFQGTGIYPFDRNIFPDNAFTQSSVTSNPVCVKTESDLMTER